MRIAFLTPEYVTEPDFDGGLSNYLHRVALALTQRGNNVEIFVLSNKNSRFIYEGIWINRVKYRILNRRISKKLNRTINILLRSYAIKRAVLRSHRLNKIDIVQSTNLHATGYFLVKSGIIPVVTRVSSFTPICRSAMGRLSYLDDAIAERLELISIRSSQAMYTPSTFLRNIIRMYEPIKIDVLKPPFFDDYDEKDHTMFNMHARGKDYLLLYGTMANYKGIDFMTTNLERILRENPKIHFFFIGKDGSNNFFQNAAGPFHNRVRYFDKMKKSQLLPFVENARAVIQPSQVDNLPNTCLESMGAGRVVVTTRTSGFADIITDGINGFLIDFGDNEQLCKTVGTICEMKQEELNNIGLEARKIINSQFSEATTINSLLQYFKNVISRQKK